MGNNNSLRVSSMVDGPLRPSSQSRMSRKILSLFKCSESKQPEKESLCGQRKQTKNEKNIYFSEA